MTLVVGLCAGCVSSTPSAPASTANPTSREAAARTATPHASAPPPSASPLDDVFGSDWETVELGSDNADPRAAVYGDAGPVIVGATCDGSVNPPDCTAAAWHLGTGGTWTSSTVEDAEGATIYEVVYSGNYIALGGRIEGDGQVVRAILWESADAAIWKVKGSVEIGDCSGEGPPCGHAERLTATPGGLIILGDVYAAGADPYYGALRSADGTHWTQIPPMTFGDPDAYIAAGLPVDGAVVALVGGGKTPMTAWRTTDGSSWTQFSTFGDVVQSTGSLALDGGLLVAAEGQSAPEGFRTTMWTSTDGQPFERSTAFDDVILTKVAFAGPAGFVGVGHDEGRPQVIASTSGRSWYRTTPGLPQIECAPSSLAGGASSALYIGDCGTVWTIRAP